MDLKEGIVVKTIDYKENSKLIFLITEEGLVSLEARGANNFKSHTALYSKVLNKIAYGSQKDHYLAGAKILEPYNNIKTDLNRYESAVKIIEMSYVLAEHITDFKTFYKFLSIILGLIEERNDFKFFEFVFKIKTLYLLGIAPVLNKCGDCESRNNLISFDFENGCMICEDCSINHKNLYRGNYIELFRKMYLNKLDLMINDDNIISDKDYSDLNKFVNLYYETYIGYTSKSSKILDNFK